MNRQVQLARLFLLEELLVEHRGHHVRQGPDALRAHAGRARAADAAQLGDDQAQHLHAIGRGRGAQLQRNHAAQAFGIGL